MRRKKMRRSVDRKKFYRDANRVDTRNVRLKRGGPCL